MRTKKNIPLKGLIIGLSMLAAHLCVSAYYGGVNDGQATLHAQAKHLK